MRIDVLTLFPQMFSALNASITGKAQKLGKLELYPHYLREYALDKHKTVDDVPFGGEPGMVLKPEPLKNAISQICQDREVHRIFLTPQGNPYTQKKAAELANRQNILIICGHYKGIDQRIREQYVDEEISIGDFVLTGGEIPAMMLIDSVARLLPGVAGDFKSLETDSFYTGDRLGWPVYTRPFEFEGKKVPEALISGHHKKIEEWREKASAELTKMRRPELWAAENPQILEKKQ